MDLVGGSQSALLRCVGVLGSHAGADHQLRFSWGVLGSQAGADSQVRCPGVWGVPGSQVEGEYWAAKLGQTASRDPQTVQSAVKQAWTPC